MKRSDIRKFRNRANMGSVATWMVVYVGLFYVVLTIITYGNSLFFPRHVPLNDFPNHAGGTAAVCPLLSTAKFRVAVEQYYADQEFEVNQYRIKVFCTIGDDNEMVNDIDKWRRTLQGYASTWTLPMSLGGFEVKQHLVVYPSDLSDHTLMDLFLVKEGDFIYSVISTSTY